MEGQLKHKNKNLEKKLREKTKESEDLKEKVRSLKHANNVLNAKMCCETADLNQNHL